MIRVLVVDDQPLVRAGIRAVPERGEELEVVGEAGDGRVALDRLRAASVDVVLMDLRMPVLDGVEAPGGSSPIPRWTGSPSSR